MEAKANFLTTHRDVTYARRALAAGAMGFVLKHSVASELVTAIREALRGRTYITPMIAGELLGSYREGNSEPGDVTHQLTPRLWEVLQIVAEGRSAKAVAAVLNISTRTAEVHKARILEALGPQNTAELVLYALRTGIITL